MATKTQGEKGEKMSRLKELSREMIPYSGVEQKTVTERRLMQWGDSILTRQIVSGIYSQPPVDMIHLQFEEPTVITLQISYSVPWASNNDTRVVVQYGTGKIVKQVEIGPGIHTFPCQNIQVTCKRLDVWSMIHGPGPDCLVEAMAVESPGAYLGYTPLALIP